MIKNMPIAEAVVLADLVTYQPGQVVSRTLAQSNQTTLTLFAFPAGEGLSAHTSPSDALAIILDGRAAITIGENEMILGAGETVVMPASVSHALEATEPFKMLLITVKDAAPKE